MSGFGPDILDAQHGDLEALRTHISELEKLLESARKERDEARAALAVSVESTNTYVSRCIALRDEVDRLKPSGQVAEEVETVRLLLGGSSSPALISLATKAHGYEAAVADNAALLDLAMMVVTTHHPGVICICPDVPKPGKPHWRDCEDAQALLAQPHPGAALLEELRQAATLLHQRPGETLPEAIRRVYADHDKAILRAMNEGLEKAASMKEYHAQQHEKRARRKATMEPEAWAQRAKEARQDADVFRAMKEPEQ